MVDHRVKLKGQIVRPALIQGCAGQLIEDGGEAIAGGNPGMVIRSPGQEEQALPDGGRRLALALQEPGQDFEIRFPEDNVVWRQTR